MRSGDRAAGNWRRVGAEAGLLLALSLLAALGAWGLRTPRLPLRAERSIYEFELKQPLISAAVALDYYEAGSHLFVDTRELELGRVAHIPGAMALRPSRFTDDLRAVIDFLDPADPIVLYGDRLQASAAVAGLLAERGYGDLSLLDGGLAAWRAAGGPLEDDPGGAR